MFFHYEPKNPAPFHQLQIFKFPYKSNQLHHKTFIFTSGNFPKKTTGRRFWVDDFGDFVITLSPDTSKRQQVEESSTEALRITKQGEHLRSQDMYNIYV